MIQQLTHNGGLVYGGTTGGIIYGHGPTCQCLSCLFSDPNRLHSYKGPQVDFRYEIEMAGTKKESISVKQKGGNLNIAWDTRLGERRTQLLPIGDKYYDMEKLSVSYEDGLLKVYVPLKPEFPPVPPEEPEIDIEIK